MHKYVIEGIHVQFCSEYVLVSCSSEGFKCVFYSKFYSTKFLNSSSGTIFTPNWPLVYPQDTICTWTFNPPASKIVRLFFTSFELEAKQECNPDRTVVTGDDIRINGEFTVLHLSITCGMRNSNHHQQLHFSLLSIII